jgi:hypothetical protein
MRRTLGFILPIVFAAAGCVSGGPFAPYEDPGPPNGDKDRTLNYWNGLRGVMSQRTKSDDLRALANLVQRQSETIRGLPPEGVDPELVSTAVAVAKCQEKVIELAEIADFELAGLRASPVVAKQFAEANQQASAAAARLAQLHARLSARYGVAFAAFER